MAVEKKFIDEENNHSIECFLNSNGLCFIECKGIDSPDMYFQQYVTLDFHTLTEFINELNLVKQEMEAIKNG